MGRIALVFSGPSGSGKSTLIRKLIVKYGSVFGFSVSHTTRTPRLGEINGKDYHFIDRDKFETMINNQEFLEWAIYDHNYYGTSFNALEMFENTIPVLDLELDGIKNLQSKPTFKGIFVFIKPADPNVLRIRLGHRGDASESIDNRMARSLQDLEEAKHLCFDKVVTNMDSDTAFEELCNYLFSTDLFGPGWPGNLK